jgi:hypothetical protein
MVGFGWEWNDLLLRGDVGKNGFCDCTCKAT